MSNFLSSLLIFMSLAVVFTYCGGIFGFAAGESFSGTLANFNNSMSVIRLSLTSPFNTVASKIGLAYSTYGGDGIVFKFEDGDVISSPLVPKEARYVAFSFTYESEIVLKYIDFSSRYAIAVFFDSEGLPLSSILIDVRSWKSYSYPCILFEGLIINSIDISNSSFTPFGKRLYLDFTINLSYNGKDYQSFCYENTSLRELKYAGSFTDLQDKIAVSWREVLSCYFG